MQTRLREKPTPPRMGDNMHCLAGHPRLAFVEQYHRPGKVLDVGSGAGAFGLRLHQLGCDVTLLDILPVVPPSEGIGVITASVYELRATAEYDTILFMEILEHLEDPLAALIVCTLALNPGGVLLITTPHVDTWDNAPDHVWRFDKEGLEGLLGTLILHVGPFGEAKCWQDETFVYAVLAKWPLS